MANKVYLLIDHQPLYSEAVKHIIKTEFQPQQVISCDDVTAAYQQLRTGDIDVLIADVELKNGSGIELVKRARKAGFTGTVLFVSSKSYQTYSSLAKSVGAQGYVTKREAPCTISKAINSVKLGYSFFKSTATTDMSQIQLSKRELSVLSYLAEGYSNKQISELLLLSEKTISTYKSRLLKKYKAPSLVHLLNSASAHQQLRHLEMETGG